MRKRKLLIKENLSTARRLKEKERNNTIKSFQSCNHKNFKLSSSTPSRPQNTVVCQTTSPYSRTLAYYAPACCDSPTLRTNTHTRRPPQPPLSTCSPRAWQIQYLLKFVRFKEVTREQNFLTSQSVDILVTVHFLCSCVVI